MWRKKSLKDKGHLRKLRMTEKTIPKIAKNKKIQPSQNNQSGQHLGENINNGVEIHLQEVGKGKYTSKGLKPEYYLT